MRSTSKQPPTYGYAPTEGLVVSRKDGQTIVLGDGLAVIQVMWTGKGRCSIRVQAPKGLRIVRGEIVDHNPTEGVA